MKGLEPPRLAAPDPKSGASTNFATSALFNGSFFMLITGLFSVNKQLINFKELLTLKRAANILIFFTVKINGKIILVQNMHIKYSTFAKSLTGGFVATGLYAGGGKSGQRRAPYFLTGRRYQDGADSKCHRK